jgi:soluble lytic murein transglycosylase-like protein
MRKNLIIGSDPGERVAPRPAEAGYLLAFILLALSFAPALRAMDGPDSDPADSIIAVQENGRTIYVNTAKPAAQAARAAAPRRASVLVYWSNTAKRWKPVPPPTPSAMRAARSAAAEVSSYIASQPASAAVSASAAATNPNYRQIARGRAVSAAEVDAAIEAAAGRHQVDPNLVRAIVKVESNFNPRAVSRAGAMGLMQLMPTTARQLNVSDPFDVQQNVDAGVRHFKKLMNTYNGDLRLSLAAYNAGETAVARSNGVPRFAETQNYVKQITSMYWAGAPFGRTFYGRGASPIHVYRGTNGVLRISNTD